MAFINIHAVTSGQNQKLRLSVFARIQGNCEKLVSEEPSLQVETFFNYSSKSGCVLDGTHTFTFKMDLKYRCVTKETKYTRYTKEPKAPIVQSGQDLRPDVESVVQVGVFVPSGARLLNSSISFECSILGAFPDTACGLNYTSLKAGSNLPGLNYEHWEPIYTSDSVNGRKDVMTIDLGTVINTAHSHYAGSDQGDKDQVNFTITIKLVGVSYPTSITFSTKTVFGKYKSEKPVTLKIAEKMQTNSQDAKAHRPILKMEIPNSRKEYSPANWNAFFVRVFAQMDSQWQLGCSNSSLTITYPSLFGNLSVLNSSVHYTPLKVFVNGVSKQSSFLVFIPATQKAFEVTFQLTFEDHLHGFEIPLRSQPVITAELVCSSAKLKAARPPLRSVASEVIRWAESPILADLGRTRSRAGKLHFVDCQLSAFHSPDPAHSIKKARYSSGCGWKVPNLGKKYADFRYMTILLGVRTYLTNVMIYTLGCPNRVLTVGIYGTNDGKQFLFYMNASVAYHSEAVGIVSLPEDTSARGFRIFFEDLKDEDGELLLAVDFMGYTNKTDVIVWEPCSNNQEPLPFPIKPMTILKTNDSLIFCLTYFNLCDRFSPLKRCYRLEDANKTLIFYFGPFVSQMIAYFPRVDILFGISMDGGSLMMSRNSGRKWVSTQMSVYHKFMNYEQNVIKAIPIPWTAKRGVFDRSTKGEKCTAYRAGIWHVCFDGIYKGERKILIWE
ncbi:unnamed protein product [Calicophoron daubneyi]|uniref:Uncharacterized protein n=1 Tax=Calicophoron daubneyi TaxID=300641 RepID=A0AAV2TTH5_CALDB